MPNGEYIRMANEAKAIWEQAQDLKGIHKVLYNNLEKLHSQ